MPKKLTAKDHIRKAIKGYLEDHEASQMGSYCDLMIDLLHIAFNDKELRKEWLKPDKGITSNPNWTVTLKDQILGNGYANFEEEREQLESDFLYGINPEDLPLYINHEWEWEFMADEFEKRLKNEGIK